MSANAAYAASSLLTPVENPTAASVKEVIPKDSMTFRDHASARCASCGVCLDVTFGKFGCAFAQYAGGLAGPSRSMIPWSGFGVSLVIPTAWRALEFAHKLWALVSHNRTGLLGATSSSIRRLGAPPRAEASHGLPLSRPPAPLSRHTPYNVQRYRER